MENVTASYTHTPEKSAWKAEYEGQHGLIFVYRGDELMEGVEWPLDGAPPEDLLRIYLIGYARGYRTGTHH